MYCSLCENHNYPYSITNYDKKLYFICDVCYKKIINIKNIINTFKWLVYCKDYKNNFIGSSLNT
jgi:hypothetical protein